MNSDLKPTKIRTCRLKYFSASNRYFSIRRLIASHYFLPLSSTRLHQNMFKTEINLTPLRIAVGCVPLFICIFLRAQKGRIGEG